MQFTLPTLPFGRGDLEPWMGRETIEEHYEKHHRAYVEKTNRLINGTRFQDASLERIVAEAEGGLYNQAAQAWNHTFFWHCLRPAGGMRDIATPLRQAILKSFSSLEALSECFQEEGKSLFGSGWVWLVKEKGSGDVAVMPGKDADNPIRHGHTPLLACDVWEHAYYLDYRHDRERYLRRAWGLLNWEFAARNFSRPFDATSLMVTESKAA